MPSDNNFFAKKYKGATPIPPPISRNFFFSVSVVSIPLPSGPTKSIISPASSFERKSVPIPLIYIKLKRL